MIKIYSANWWGSCIAAKKLLDDKGLSYKEINIENDNIDREKLMILTGGYTIPQIIINNKPIGGFENLLILNQNKKLDNINDESWNISKNDYRILP